MSYAFCGSLLAAAMRASAVNVISTGVTFLAFMCSNTCANSHAHAAGQRDAFTSLQR